MTRLLPPDRGTRGRESYWLGFRAGALAAYLVLAVYVALEVVRARRARPRAGVLP